VTHGDHIAVTEQVAPAAPQQLNSPEPKGPSGIARLMPKSLTGRLVAGVVTLVFLLVVVIGSATYIALKQFLTNRLDQQVLSVATNQTINRYLVTPAPTGTVVHGPQDIWIAVLTPSGSVFKKVPEDESLHVLDLTSPEINYLLSHLSKPRTIEAADGTSLRVVSKAIKLTDIQTGATAQAVAVIGLSTQDVRDTMRQLLLLEVAIGAVAVALAAGVTTWGVRRGLRPLHRVTRTAQEVTAELGPDGSGLERRVPNADPTTEVGQVASSVNTLLQTVEAEFAARLRNEERMRQFLADASHELRTPLTSIRGYAELSRLQGSSSNGTDDPMRRIEVEGTRMSRLVEDLLVLARGDQDSPMQHERVDVDAVMSEAASAAMSAHPDRQISMVRSGGAAVVGDRDQLLRLLLNLLTNAAIHTKPDGPIRLEAIQGRTPAGPAIALKVIDAGPGLPADEAAHVFERFWRADKARSRAKGGSGLGMAIVAQIVQSHGGVVEFQSSVEAGTTVTVTLPMAAASPAAH
jgi:two-component system OmpR family sensor kinase